MGTPQFEPAISLEGNNETLHIVDMGNPHAVMCVDNINTAPVNTLGPTIETHAHFPAQTNVGFFERVNEQHIKLRVHERGAGETKACGSGACAAAAVMQKFYEGAPHIQVDLLGGKLTIDWQGDNATLMMTGPAEFVYEGKLLNL